MIEEKITNESRSKFGALSGGVGIITNLLLAVLKLIFGLLTASVAIMADALNNLSDAGSSIVSLVSFKLSEKPADKDHPFGHARIEYVASMVVSFLILLVGFEMLSDSLGTIIGFNESEKPSFTTATFIILAISVVVKLLLALFYLKVAKKIDSSVIKASALDSLFDSVSTLAVLISSIVIKLTDITIIDSVVGLFVSVLILWAGIKTLNETKNSILGEAPVKETVNNILRIVKDYPEIIGTHDLIVHNYGPGHYIASLHAEVDGSGDFFTLHDIIDNVERRIGEELNILCTIHLDPINTNDELVNKYKSIVVSLAHEISEGIGIHDLRIVTGNTHTNLIFDVEIPFESEKSCNQIIKSLEEKMKEKCPECYCVITVDRY